MTWRTRSEQMGIGLLVLSLFVVAKPAEAAVSAGDKLNCEAEFVEIMEGSRYTDLGSKIKRWEALRPQCARTGTYEANLGTLYTQAEKYEVAKKIVREGLAKKTNAEKDLRLVLYDIDARQGKLRESEAQARSLIKDFPDWHGGYVALGETLLIHGRLYEGVDNLERANSLTPNLAAYKLLAIAYYKIGRPRDSAIAMQKAIKIHKGALKDTQAVCATAYSLVAIGEFAAADDLLVKHLRVQPTASNDPTYQKASAFVAKRTQESQGEKK